MKRFTQVLVLLLLAIPLFRLPGMGPDALRIPVWGLCVTLLMGGIVYSEARQSEVKGKFDPLRISLIVFVLVAVFSLLGGGSFWAALPSLIVLTLGLLTYFILSSPFFHSRDLLSWGFPSIAVVGALFSAVVMFQAFRGDPVIGTLGNPNRAGAFAGILFPVMLGLCFSPKFRPLFIGSSIALLVATVLTDSRGGLLGLAAGSAVVLGGLAWRWKRGRGLLMVGGGVLLVAFLFIPLVQKRMDSVRVRTELWKGSFQLALDNPVLGTGVGNFAVEFPPYRTEEEFLISNRNEGLTSFVEAEDAHSTWMQIAAEMGILGILAFLLVLYVAVRLWRYYLVHLDNWSQVAGIAGVGGGVVAFLAAGLTNTLHLHASHFLLFILFLSFIQVIGDRRSHTPRRFSWEVRMAIHGVQAFLGILIIVLSLRQGSNDRLFQDAMGQPSGTRIRLLKELNAVDDHYWRAHYELGPLLSSKNQYGEAVHHCKSALEERPHHVVLLNRMGIALLGIGGKDEEAGKHLLRAAEIAPYYFRTWYNLGTLAGRAGDWETALLRFNTAISLRPDHLPSRVSRAKVHYILGNKAAAFDDLLIVRSNNPEEIKRLQAEGLGLENDPVFSEIFSPVTSNPQ